MKPVKKSVLALAVLLTACAGHAQLTAANSAPAGRLGQRYVGASFGVVNFEDAPEELYDTSIGVNLPVTKSVDVDFGYSYQWLRNNPVDLYGHSVDAGATVYLSTHGVKPFASASLGYAWTETSFGGVSLDDDYGFYGISVGLEAAVGPVIVTPVISYADTFTDGDEGTYGYGIDFHHWFTAKLGARAAISYSDYGSGVHSWNYRIGLRLKF